MTPNDAITLGRDIPDTYSTVITKFILGFIPAGGPLIALEGLIDSLDRMAISDQILNAGQNGINQNAETVYIKLTRHYVTHKYGSYSIFFTVDTEIQQSKTVKPALYPGEITRINGISI